MNFGFVLFEEYCKLVVDLKEEYLKKLDEGINGYYINVNNNIEKL